MGSITVRLKTFCSVLILTGALTGCVPTKPTPIIEPPPPPPPPPSQQIESVGCYLRGAAAAGNGGLQEMLRAGLVYAPSGNYLIDTFTQQEAVNLVVTFGLYPRVFFLVDPSPNAFATPEIANPQGPDGSILFGQNLMRRQLERDAMGASVVAIMAHEFGHLAQFKLNVREPGKRPELHADFIAGWYMNLRGRYAWTDLRSSLQTFYEVGDYDFNSPGHHGTPAERLAAAQAGFNSGATTAPQAYALGWQYVK